MSQKTCYANAHVCETDKKFFIQKCTKKAPMGSGQLSIHTYTYISQANQ